MMFGPKKTSLLACVPICLAWVLMSRADDIYVVYTSRMLTGHILKHNFSFFASLSQFFYNTRVNKYNLFHCLGLGNGILTSSVYIVEVVSATRRGSVVMVGGLYIMVSKCNVGEETVHLDREDWRRTCSSLHQWNRWEDRDVIVALLLLGGRLRCR